MFRKILESIQPRLARIDTPVLSYMRGVCLRHDKVSSPLFENVILLFYRVLQCYIEPTWKFLPSTGTYVNSNTKIHILLTGKLSGHVCIEIDILSVCISFLKISLDPHGYRGLAFGHEN